jgi:hypothetical protein
MFDYAMNFHVWPHIYLQTISVLTNVFTHTIGMNNVTRMGMIMIR